MDHPLRVIRAMTDEGLRRLSSRFEAFYASTGRPSVPPEQLLRALLLQVLYSVRSERMLMEQLEYNLLFRWFKKANGHEAKRVYLGEVLMENRHGLVVDACVVPATGTGERDAATSLVASLPPRRVTIGGDKGYVTHGFVDALRTLEATPHIAQRRNSRTLDGRTTRHPGYAISQRARKRIEEVFGWMKTVGGLRKLRHRGGVSLHRSGLQPSADANAPSDGLMPAAEPIDACGTPRLLNRPSNLSRHERSNFSILLAAPH